MMRAGALGRAVLKLFQVTHSQWTALVWVDDNSLIREVQFTSPPIARAGGANIILTCNTQALGSSIKVKDPPANQVIPSTALTRRAQDRAPGVSHAERLFELGGGRG
jgi:hypothetical protein